MVEAAADQAIEPGDRVVVPHLDHVRRGQPPRARLLDRMPQDVAKSFTDAQLGAIERALE